MNPYKRACCAALLILAALFTGCGGDDGEPEAASHDHTEQTNPSEDEHAHQAANEHAHEEDESIVRLTAAQSEEFGIEVAEAAAGELEMTLSLPGEVVFNPDRIVHVTPHIPGVVREVYRTIGDRVEAGDRLALLDSRQLAEAKAEFLASLARLDLAEANFQREKTLWEQKITPEAEYLAARQALEEARIQRRLAERRLHAMGLSEAGVERIPAEPEDELTLYELTAPLSGMIVQRHVTRGEVVPEQPADPPFVIADISEVWVHLTVYARDLDVVRPGQTVLIRSQHGALEAEGRIDYISPSLGQATRTATAGIVLDNPDGLWRPGLFVTGRVRTRTELGRIVIPRDAVQTIGDRPVVFVRTDGGFVPRPVETGSRSDGRIEIAAGLEPGERYASANAFTLKAELNRSALEHAGHAH